MGLESSLAEQYNKTLQSTIGQSQQERQRAMRSAPSQVASTDPSVDWASRQASGFRGAGFNEVNSAYVPNMDTETASYMKPFMGNYQEAGKTQQGFYGDVNPYTEQGADKIFKDSGYKLAAGQEDPGYQAAGFDLPTIFGKNTYYKDFDFTQKSGVDSYLGQQGFKDLGLASSLGLDTIKNTPEVTDNLARVKDNLYAKNNLNLENYRFAPTAPAKNYDYLWSSIQAPSVRQTHPDSVSKALAAKVDEAKKYASAGFIPGQSTNGWDYKYGTFAGKGSYPADTWSKGSDTIYYTPSAGYNSIHNMGGREAWLDDLKGIGTVASIIGGIVLPGLGTSWAGLAGNAAGNAGVTLPSLSTTSLGLSGGTATLADAALSKAISSGVSAGMSGGNVLQSTLRGGIGGLAGGVGGELSKLFGGYVGDMTGNADIGNIVSNVTGSVGGQGLANLLMNNKFGANMGQAAIQGGMASLGNIFAPKGSTPQLVKQMNKVGTSAGGLANTLYNKQKLKAK